MKRPTYVDLANVRAAIQVCARSMKPDDPFRLSIERVEPWLKVEADRALARDARACTSGRNHRVREVKERYADGIVVERCRCGAERVRDEHTREVSDWIHPLPSAQGSSSDA